MASAKKKLIYVHHDGGLGGAPISLSFLIPCIPKALYDTRMLLIARGPVEKLFSSLDIAIDIDEKIHPFHGSTVSGMNIKLFVRNFLYLAQSFIFSLRYMKSHQPDIVHLNSSCLFIVALAVKIVNRKTKVICHVREPLLKYSICGTIMKFMNYLFVDHFIGIDQYAISTMRTKENYTIIYNSVDFDKFAVSRVYQKNLRTQLGIKKEDTLFLYLARVDESNGVLELLDAISQFQHKYGNDSASFIISGFRLNDNKRYLKKVNSVIGKMKKIYKLNFVEDVPTLLAQVDLVVVPFTKPHFARCIIEASAMALPSIGHHIPGVDELIKHGTTGYLYRANEEFVDLCALMINNIELRKKLSENALAFAKEEFDHRKNAEKVLTVYQRSISRKS